jgi:hypothetical protein
MFSMDDDYYRYPVGSPEHYAAYEKWFIATGGVGAAIPGDDPQASYEIDNAYELAAERYDESEDMYRHQLEEEAEADRWWRARESRSRGTFSAIARAG